MNIVPQTKSLAQRHERVGYALYQGGQPITACQSNEQRRGWHNAQVGEMAAVDADTAVYLDEAAELMEYREWIADQDYHRSGAW